MTGRTARVKAILLAAMALAALVLGGCQTYDSLNNNDNQGCAAVYWLTGPKTDPDKIKKGFDQDVKLGALRADVEKVLGKPTDFILQTDSTGKAPEDSRAGWMLYKYDYPDTPVLLTVQLDQFGIVVGKHYDDKETVAKLAAQKAAQEKAAEGYEGGPQKRFQDLIKKHASTGD
jgi:hypothetical protein